MLWYVLMQSLSPDEYERTEKLFEEYCDLWVKFWNAQMKLINKEAEVLVSA